MDNPSNRSGSTTTGIIIGILALLCCVCVIALGAAGYWFYSIVPSEITDIPVFTETEPTVQPELTRPPVETITSETLETLQNTIVPVNDPRVLACRLQALCDIPEVTATSAVTRAVGDKDNFWVTNLDNLENVEITATLRYVTPHVYFWVQDGVQVDEDEVAALGEEFENKIY
ncbi:MAG TPA: hypothetical protein DIW23_05170, partial [Anaerolineae bacterium]|nr:hypothetical protein [Anaerolineae bacterium]